MNDIDDKNSNDRMVWHLPVLKSEVIDWMQLEKGMIVADLTLGAGGHALEILSRIGRDGRLVGVDKDQSIIDLLPRKLTKSQNVEIVCGSFADFDKISQKLGIDKYDRILLDLGVSSWQLDNNNRGFSYQNEALLDMRMNSKGHTAAWVLNNYDELDLEKMWRDYGDIRRAKSLVKKVASFRRAKSFKYVSDLKNLVEEFAHYKEKKRNILGRVWQALRIEVNGEYTELRKVLPKAIARLKKGGRLLIISFHSGEDRIVKDFFRDLGIGCICPKEFPLCRCGHKKVIKILTRKPMKPSELEIKNNIRSHSARLRVAQKIE